MNAPTRPAVITCLIASLALLASTVHAQRGADTARVRVIHASPGTPAVDVLVNDERALFNSLMFGDVTEYAEVPANVYDTKVVPAGAGPESAALQADLNLFYGTDYTVVALDTFTNVRPLVLVDDAQQPAPRQAKVRFLHAVPDAPAVDIKVVDGPFLFQDVPFESLADYVTLPAEEYALEVRVAGSDAVVVELSPLALPGGSSFTILAYGLLANGSLDAMVFEDNTNPAVVSPVPELPPRPLQPVEIRALDSRTDSRIR